VVAITRRPNGRIDGLVNNADISQRSLAVETDFRSALNGDLRWERPP
jgi:hypothetical protein